VGDQKGERNRRELRQIVDDFRTSLANLRKDFRAALLSSKRVIDTQKISLRDELIGSSAVREKQCLGEKVAEDALMKANDDVTDALRRTVDLMQSELERSVLASQMLDESSATLRSTSNVHDTLTTVMDTSKQLIVALEKSDWLDRLLILSGLAFFMLVVLFILKQRIVDRGLRIAFWWTKFLPDVKMGSSRGVQSTGLEMATVLSAATTTTSAALMASSSLMSTGHPSQTESSEGSLSTALENISGLSPSAFSSPSTYPVTEAPPGGDERTRDNLGQRDEL